MKAMSFPLRRRICRQPKKLGLASRRAIRMPDAIHPIRALGWFGGSDCAARMPAVQPFPLVSKDLPTAEEARSGEPARDPDAGRNSSDQHIGMLREPTSGKPSIGRRAFRSVVHFFITALIAVLIGVAASSGWQSYGDDAKEIGQNLGPVAGPIVIDLAVP